MTMVGGADSNNECIFKRRVKRKLFDDAHHHQQQPLYCTPPTSKTLSSSAAKRVRRANSEVQISRWRPLPIPVAAVIPQAAYTIPHFQPFFYDDVCLSDSDREDWQSVADSQETYSEFEHISSTSSESSVLDCSAGSGGRLLAGLPGSPPAHMKHLDFCSVDSVDDTSVESSVADSQSNFTWLLNFKVESLFQTPWDHPVSHDHNYKTHPAECPNMAATDKQEAVLDQYPLSSQYSQISRGIRKPPYTYTELIELALRDRGELTVSGIYKWIMEHFPFFKATDDRWKNSVRHNLSINANFKKGRKAQGSSHLWTIATDTEKRLKQDLLNHTSKNHWKKRKLEELEQTYAVKGTYVPVMPQPVPPSSEPEAQACPPPCNNGSFVTLIKTEDTTDDSPAFSPPENITLTKSAEDILNGDVEKKVEVQLLTPLRPMAYTFMMESPEFLNPITRREVVQESGLLDDASNAHMVHTLPQQIFNNICTDLDPASNLFEDELALGYLNISP